MINFAREGDTIVVWRLDRLGRNMQDLIQLVNALNKRGGVAFHSLQENLTLDKRNATGQLMFHLFAAFAEFKRNLNHKKVRYTKKKKPLTKVRGLLIMGFKTCGEDVRFLHSKAKHN